MRSHRAGFAIAAAVSLALCAAGHSRAAEALKLRPLAPVYAGFNGVGLLQPEGISCRGDKQLVVADTGNRRLVVYTVGAESISPNAEIVLTQLPRPVRVETLSDGRILALDGKLHRIARLSPSGEFLGYVDPAGVSGDVVPRSLEIDDDDRLYILDIFSERILVLDESGKLEREIAFPDEYGFFSDVAVGRGGTVYVIDSVARQAYVARKGDPALSALSGDLSDAVAFPTSLTVDRGGRLLVGDQNGGGIVVLGQDGSFLARRLDLGWKVGLVRYPSDLCIDGSGLLHVADRGNNRIQTYGILQ